MNARMKREEAVLRALHVAHITDPNRWLTFRQVHHTSTAIQGGRRLINTSGASAIVLQRLVDEGKVLTLEGSIPRKYKLADAEAARREPVE